MGKIPVQDLAKMMGISNQDLVFKLRSIGVRVEGDSAHIDTDIISAILQGKKLPHPREVILRDEPASPAQPQRRQPAAPARRPPANPLRPARPRTLIQKVEPSIRSLPTLERERQTESAEEAFLAPPEEIHEEQIAESAVAQEAAPAALATPAAAAPPPQPAPPPAAPPRRQGPLHPSMIDRPMTPRPAGDRPVGPRPGGPSLRTDRPLGPRPGGPSLRTDRPPGPRPGGPSLRTDRPMGGPRPSGDRPMGPRPGGPRPGDRPMGGRPGDRPMGGRPGDRPMGPRPGGPRPTGDRPMGPRPGAGMRPGGPLPLSPPPARERDRTRGEGSSTEPLRDEKKAKRAKKPGTLRSAPDENLSAYRGALKSIEEVEEVEDGAISVPVSGRRKRRVERRQEEADRGGSVPQFREAAPTGPVMISEGMTVRDFSEKLGVKSKDLIKMLFSRGILANINHIIEPELAQQLAAQMGIETLVVSFEEEVQLKQELSTKTASGERVPRAPVVTIMGHVDHGKTSLLDAIRSSKVAEGEHGGITQHIGAYKVNVGKDRSVVFLDTPGHEAFTMMRSRGARATDIVVLVVAADDGVMPQTVEAIDHARAAKVPLVVAINKVDKDNANLERVKKQLADQKLLVEEWGGDTVAVPMSATKKEGVSELLEMILLTADMRDLKSSPDIPAQGTVLEARKDIGRGIVATVLVQDGTLSVGDLFVSGATWGRVRAMADDDGNRIEKAGASTPVEVTGFGELPDAGDLFQVVEDEAKARSIAEFRRQEQRKRDLTPTAGRLSLEQLFNKIEEGSVKELPVIVKADVQGSVEVLRDTLEKASTEKVKVRVISAAAGAISTNDVLLASASGAIIIGFNVRPERNAAELAEKEGVDIRLHTVIYELADELRKAMTGLLEPVFEEQVKGRAEVREIFKVPKAGMIAGCHVLEGTIPRSAQVRLLRDNIVIHDGRIGSLRRFKDDASEVRAGFDCGIALERYQDLKPQDIIEAYVRKAVTPEL